jgi:mRNA interferase RelE/StbE
MFKVIWDECSQDNLQFDLVAKIRQKINAYLIQSPKELGKPLSGIYKGYRSYRYGDHRIIYKVLEAEQTIIIVRIDHRRKVYK